MNSQDAVASVRDLYEQKRKRDQETKIPSKNESEARSRMWFDFEEMLDKNDENANSGVPKIAQTASKTKIIGDLIPAPSNAKHFSQSSFRLNKNDKKKRKFLNWTTCEEIGGDLKFHPKAIVDIEWLPFYTWFVTFLPHVYPHVFSIPSVKVGISMLVLKICTVTDTLMRSSLFFNRQCENTKENLEIN